MLGDYRTYLLGIRDSLIRSGVEVPMNPMDSYRDIFYEGMKLDSILWYYSVLAVSGSENALSDFILPIGGYYKERMRQLFYKEFLNFIPEYKAISKAYLVPTIKNRVVEEDKDTNPSEDSLDLGINSGTEEECSYDTEETTEESEEGNSSASDFLKFMVNMGGGNKIVNESVNDTGIIHGTYIEDIELSSEISAEREEMGVDENSDIVHGIYIEDMVGQSKEEGNSEVYGTYIEDIIVESPPDDTEVHGTYIEDIQVSSSPSSEEIHGIYIEDIIVEGSEGNLDDSVVHGIYIEDIEVPDPDDEDYEDVYADGYVDSEEEYEDEENYEDVYADGYVDPEEDEDDEENYDDVYADGYVDPEEDYEDDEENEDVYADGYVDPEEEYEGEENYEDVYADGYEDPEEESFEDVGDTFTEDSGGSDLPPSTQEEKESEPDLADNLTKLVNITLTKGKRLIRKEFQKMTK